MNKKLQRSGSDKVFGGVACGLAEYFDISPAKMRTIFIITLFAGGISLLLYITLWIVTPESPIEAIAGKDKELNEQNDFNHSFSITPKTKRAEYIGIILIIIGFIMLIEDILKEKLF